MQTIKAHYFITLQKEKVMAMKTIICMGYALLFLMISHLTGIREENCLPHDYTSSGKTDKCSRLDFFCVCVSDLISIATNCTNSISDEAFIRV